MKDENKAPNLWELIRKWVYARFGVGGLIVLILLGVAFFLYTNWDKVSNWPGVKPVIAAFSRWSIPKADPNRFSIMVAHLGNDSNRDYERLIVEGLKEFEGIQVLALDRTIPLEGPVPEEEEKRGHESALRYLRQSGASVLIWGTVLSQGGRTIPKLYWTTSSGREREQKRYDAPLLETRLRLPEVFWSDLGEILRLLAASRSAEFNAKSGHYVADQLPPFIARVKTLLETSPNRPGWDMHARGITRVILAMALSLLGEQSGRNEFLSEAVDAYREALKERTRERVPLQWARTQNNLGNALRILGERESGTARLEQAVDAYREALKERTRERVPLQWARTQNNLGNALGTLGERESGTARLEQAVDVFREALKERTRERVPLQWAMTQNNLGNALRILGERESGTARLEQAVDAYREALKERTRERVPLQWAMTQNNLGNALGSLGERESGTARLEQAVDAYREALKERTRERVPLQWAMTQNNLGTALRPLGERESGTARLEQAVDAYREALKERTRERVPLQWAMTQNNLGNALRALGERESGTARLEQAVDAFREALKERTRERVPLQWAMTQNNLGNALRALGERCKSNEYLDQAKFAFQSAHSVFKETGYSLHDNYFEETLRELELIIEKQAP